MVLILIGFLLGSISSPVLLHASGVLHGWTIRILVGEAKVICSDPYMAPGLSEITAESCWVEVESE